LISRDGETCTLDINGKPTNFRTTAVKPYYRDISTDSHDDGQDDSHDESQEEDNPADND